MIELTVEQGKLAELAKRLASEADGKRLRLELSAGLRVAVAPAVSEIRAGALAIKRGDSISKRSTKKNPVAESAVSLGAAIARGVGVQTRLAGRYAGVTVRARKSGMPRGFANAPKRINAKHFRHKVFGREVWVTQIGAPGFFDNPLKRDQAKYRAACVRVMDAMAARIAK